jgi:DnaJ homolog subfamily C member 7
MRAQSRQEQEQDQIRDPRFEAPAQKSTHVQAPPSDTVSSRQTTTCGSRITGITASSTAASSVFAARTCSTSVEKVEEMSSRIRAKQDSSQPPFAYAASASSPVPAAPQARRGSTSPPAAQSHAQPQAQAQAPQAPHTGSTGTGNNNQHRRPHPRPRPLPRPTPSSRSSRTFTRNRNDNVSDPDSDLDKISSNTGRPLQRRSTSYASPLELGDPSLLSTTPDRLTRSNLDALLKDPKFDRPCIPPPESASSTTPSTTLPTGKPRLNPSTVTGSPRVTTRSGTDRRTGTVNGIGKAMPKTKSPTKKSDKKKPKPDDNPLNYYHNLSPDEVRRLSAAMARDERRTSTPMDVDEDTPANGTSQPPTPSHDAPGAFPGDAEDATSSKDRDEKSPTPPPHRVPPAPKVDPEACKAAGNKFFKAKDYDRAVQEYTKGKIGSGRVLLCILTCCSRRC